MRWCVYTEYPDGVPNKPKTPIRTVRVESSLWARALAKATAEGTTVSVVVRDFLARWVKE